MALRCVRVKTIPTQRVFPFSKGCDEIKKRLWARVKSPEIIAIVPPQVVMVISTSDPAMMRSMRSSMVSPINWAW